MLIKWRNSMGNSEETNRTYFCSETWKRSTRGLDIRYSVRKDINWIHVIHDMFLWTWRSTLAFHKYRGFGYRLSKYSPVEVWWHNDDAREGKWRGNWRMQWVASTLTLPRNMVYPALLPLMRTPRLPVVDWTDAPADINGLVRFAQRQNLVTARVSSNFKRAIPTSRSIYLFFWADWMMS